MHCPDLIISNDVVFYCCVHILREVADVRVVTLIMQDLPASTPTMSR